MNNAVFGEYFARRKNALTEANARLKMIFVIIAILATLLSKTIYLPLAIIFTVSMGLASVKVPFKIIMLRLSAPLGISITMFLIRIFFCHDSLNTASLVLLKIIGASSLILFLSMTTTLDKLLEETRRLKVPAIWIEICLIAYRYIFVLLEDAVTVFDAQRVRLGYAKFTTTLESLGNLVGMIIIRAYDQSISTYEAMMLRGYREKE